MMTLYDFVSLTQSDFDVFDTEYDTSVTVCYIGEEEDDYDRFCNGITKKVNVLERCNNITLVVNWSDFIKRNMEKFRAFSNQHWYEDCQYDDDDDEFVYQWIKEIHSYMAGYVSDDFYTELVAFVEELN